MSVDCPECEACCALAICCPPASEEQRVAMTNLLIKDGKWTNPELARKIADATIDHYFVHGRKDHESLEVEVNKIIFDFHKD